MPVSPLHDSFRPAPVPNATPTGGFVDQFGGRYYEIAHAERLPVFFMNIATSCDLWLFVASNGGLTAGRCDSDHALFPYQPVDRVYDSASSVGPVTAIWIQRAGAEPVLWEPFAARTGRVRRITRRLYKSLEGDRVWFEELNQDHQIVFRYGWSTAAEYGFVRTAEIENTGAASLRLRVLDGLRHLLAPGISRRLQDEYSCLADAYKMGELVPDSTLAVYTLASGITDRPVPLESLRAAVAWCEGLPHPTVMVSEAQLAGFLEGRSPATETLRRGVRASYLVASEFDLDAGEHRRWVTAADTDRSAADVVELQLQLKRGTLSAAVERACGRATERLRALVGAADGLQKSGDETATAHHFSNVLFNVMRGGVFAANHEVRGRDFADYVSQRQRQAAGRHASLLAGLPERLPRSELVKVAADAGDPQLERLALEYLPLIFSRRHGDPSRPWNRFQVRVGSADSPVLHYEGNWRDIFQNWEALGRSFPEFLDGLVATFVNASTLDGYNPYRLTRSGIEWEVPNPDDPWSSIGYWGDHQVIYLLKLMEACADFYPGKIAAWLRRELFTYAAVPYRIAGYDQLRRDPRHTIAFDAGAHAAIERRVASEGTDARLVVGREGLPQQVNLTEKLLVLVLSRLVNFVPGGGIWMNTQRPEWNDGNNALVGAGVSVVTLAYLRRFLTHWRDVLAPALGDRAVAVSASVAGLMRRVRLILERHVEALAAPMLEDEERRAIVDQLGAAGSAYREAVYATGTGAATLVEPAEVCALIDVALRFVDDTLRSNRRGDGLYHAYNLIEFAEEPGARPVEGNGAAPPQRRSAAPPRPTLRLRQLGTMLEGQVAILSSGLLTPGEAVEVLTALRRSELYRSDQDSYLLHPDRARPGFLARGVIPAETLERWPWLSAMIDAGDTRLVERDATGVCRFCPQLVNAEAVVARLTELGQDARWSAQAKSLGAAVLQLHEEVFAHHGFTGRSGAMFGYEGLGCIYWHMVAKLLLATQENLARARRIHDPAGEQLARLYEQVRDGLGFRKPPAAYGAFPTDPYSHTPAQAGAQQPGMTGQVKEEILTRWGELGVHVGNGRLTFDPGVVTPREFLRKAAVFHYVTIEGSPAAMTLPADSLAFTVCGTPVVYHQGQEPWRVRVHYSSGLVRVGSALALDPAVSAAIFARSGAIRKIELTSVRAVSSESSHESRCETESSVFSPSPAPWP